ncbi:MAG: DNA cytosine methyltransferase [Chloroflexi bacterium]|uniref:DNA cytosine methyltransferase n=1 Tax=Candidatus Flexifilum breve TaxID=3140694 RepID=UPI003135076D|nr:DNA cytosine methyltransferase [Chloroflexota bacterium]
MSAFLHFKGQQAVRKEGKRGTLYLEFMRAVIQLQPKFFVFENVPGLASANNGEVYNIIRSDLGNLGDKQRFEEICSEMNIGASSSDAPPGYDILFDGTVDAPNLGIPQTRRRLIIIGIRRDLFDRFHILKQYQYSSEFEHRLQGKNTLFPIFPLTAIEAFEGKPLPELQDKYVEIMQAYADLAKESSILAVTTWREDKWKNVKFDILEDYFTANNISKTPFRVKQYEEAMDEHEALLKEMNWRDIPVEGLDIEDDTVEDPNTTQGVMDRMFMIPPDENYQFVHGTPWQVEGKGISFIYRRSSPLKPAWTVVAYGGGGTHGYHYERNRAQLTLRERARIQTFTDNYHFTGPGVRAQIGEAVPPLMAKRIAEAISSLLEEL